VWRSSENAERSVLVLTCVDGALRDPSAGLTALARQAVAELSASGVPIILASHHSRSELVGLQRELGLEEPCIAENGGVICIPSGHFARLPDLAVTNGQLEIIEFVPPSIEDAIDMLIWLYRVSGDSPLLVGVGASWNDHLLLRHVDVPVLVKSASIDQHRLRSEFPEAYVTSSTGLSGWREAILGARRADADGNTANR
jgi:predicted mannosyl-3-phosphoglycerate phosphatase (HAD superfamily)